MSHQLQPDPDTGAGAAGSYLGFSPEQLAAMGGDYATCRDSQTAFGERHGLTRNQVQYLAQKLGWVRRAPSRKMDKDGLILRMFRAGRAGWKAGGEQDG